MSWADLTPIVKVIPSAKAAVVINNDGRPRVNLSFSEPFFREMGEPKKLHVQAGTGENLGKVRLVLGQGNFTVRELEKGGGKIQFPLPEGLPVRVRELEPCEVVERPDPIAVKAKGGSVIVSLPLDPWAQQGAASAALAQRQREESKPAPPPKPASTTRLEAVPYLRAKGVKISKMAGDWWSLNGDKVGRMEVLARVNECRKAAGIVALGLENIE